MDIMKTKIGIFILILIIASGMVYLFSNNKNNVVIQESVLTQSDNGPSSFADWQVYQNKEYGFEIKLPKTWSVTVQDSGFFLNPDVPGPRDSFYAPIQMSIRENKENMSISNWFLKNYPKNKEDLKNFSTIRIDSNEDAMVWYHKNDSFKIYTYYIKNAEKIYEFSLADIQEDLVNENEMMKTIVSSFKIFAK
jgi:hypothetical protein